MANDEIPLAAAAMVDNVVDDGNNGSTLLPDNNNNVVGTTTKKQRNTFRRLTKQHMGKTIHPFLDEPDYKELVLYRCLARSQPFTTAKGRGLTEAWTVAVEEINKQKNLHTNQARPYSFHPFRSKRSANGSKGP